MVDFKDELTRISAAGTGLVRTLVTSLGPTIVKIAEWFRKAAMAASDFFARLGLGSEIQQATVRLEDLYDRAFRINELLDEGMAGSGFLFGYQRQNLLNELQQINIEVEKTQAKLQQMKSASGAGPGATFDVTSGVGAGVTGTKEKDRLAANLESFKESLMNEEELLANSHAKRLAMLNEFRQANLVTDQELRDYELQLNQEHADALVAISKSKVEEQQRLEQQLTETVSRYRMQSFQEGINILRLFGQKKKAFAVAAIIAERAFAIASLLIEQKRVSAQIQMDTAAAIIKTYAAYGNTPAGAAAAGQMAALGAAALAAANTAAVLGIAGQVLGGAFELSSLNSGAAGGASATYAVDPITGQPLGIESTTSRTPSTTVTINLGNTKVFSDEAIRELIEAINEQIDDGVTIKGIMVA
jgi:hypothetical protein